MKIAILGFGVLGKAVYASIDRDPTFSKALIYDPFYDRSCTKEEVLTADQIIVCLPTPTNADNTTQDFSVCKEWLDYLVESEYEGLICWKSTTLFNNIQPYLDKLRIVMNPEFLNARTSIEDFHNQTVIVLGSNNLEDSIEVEDMYRNCFNLPYVHTYKHVSPYAAVHVKYISNLYHAYKCTFWNIVQENTGSQQELFDLYATVWQKNQKEEMAFVQNPPRGFSGQCWPKDSVAINSDWQNPVIAAMIDYNASLQKGK